jgi:uncharacterized damage-inducible protein DinB
MQETTIAATFLAFAGKRLQTSATDITRCVAQLTEEQIWHRGGEYENSIANLLQHLAGNMRQWILHGIDGQPDIRKRDEEFALTSQLTAAEAHTLFTTTLDECLEIIRSLQPKRLLDIIDPQPTGTMRHLPVLNVIFQVVGHVQLHTGQIIVLSKQMLGRDLDLYIPPRKR